MRLMSDVPLGAMLSGGLDSSLIVALMARHMDRAGQDVRGRLRAATDSELGDARRVAECHRRRPPRARGRARGPAPPTCSSSSRGTWTSRSPTSPRSASSRSASWPSQHVTVALSGQGADELLGGYRKHRVASLAEHWDRVPGPLRAGCRPRARRGPGPRPAGCSTRSSAGDPVVAPARLQRPRATRPAGRPVRGRARRAAPTRRARIAARPPRRRAGRRAARGALYLDAKLGLVDDMLTYFDRASMAHSLEVRVPFLDHELVELCARDPDVGSRSTACRASTCCGCAARGPGPGLRARQAQARLLQRGRADVAGADGGAVDATRCC